MVDAQAWVVVTEQRNSVGHHLVRLVVTSESIQAIGQAGVTEGVIGGGLGEAHELFACVVEAVGFEQDAGEVRSGRGEAGVDSKCFTIAIFRPFQVESSFKQQPKAMVRLCDVLVDVDGAAQVFFGHGKVAALQFNEGEVDEGVDEAGVILEGEGDTGVGEGQVATGEGLDSCIVELDGLWGEGSLSGATEQQCE